MEVVPMGTVRSKKGLFLRRVQSQKTMIFIALVVLLYVFIFRYLPLWGWVMAFQDYQPGDSILGGKWVGLANFAELFRDPQFYAAMRNTLAMSFINLIVGTAACIFLALIFNETRNLFVKRIVQTVSYLPYFVSWVVAASIVVTFLSLDGTLNSTLVNTGIIEKPILWLAYPDNFWTIIGLSNVWKNVGFGAIVYLASMSGIDPNLYEAAAIDGAGRLARIWHVTLPSILPTIIVLLILHIGGILNTGFEQQMLLGNSMVSDVSEVLDLFVLKYGIGLGQYSYTIAAGMFKSVVSIVLIMGANLFAKRLGQPGIY